MSDSVNCKKRASNIELLRIISMLMVTILHATVITEDFTRNSNYYLCFLLRAFCFVAVNVFIIITGYFMVTSGFKLKKLLVLWGEVFFYSVGLSILSMLLNLQSVTVGDLVGSIFPVLHQEYWFITFYILLYLMSPIINIAIQKLTENQLGATVFCAVLLFSVMPTFFRPITTNAFEIDNGYSILWFIVLYIIGAYIRLYGNPQKGFGIYFARYVLFTLITFVFKWTIEIITVSVLGESVLVLDFFQYNSFTVLLASVFLFMAFLNLEIKNEHIEKIIIYISPCSLACYLIHLNPNFRYWLWDDMIRTVDHYEQTSYIFYVLSCSCLVFLISCAIDKCRQRLYRKVFSKCSEKIVVEVEKLFYRIEVCAMQTIKK